MKFQRKSNGQRLEGVAPLSMLREDYTALDAKSVLRCSYDIEELLLMQSVEGHAHAGHGLFYGRTYPNTTQDDVARALRMDPNAVKAEHQELIDDIREFVERVVRGEELHTACNSYGEPLLGCGIFRSLDIDPRGVLKGLYLGGLRDEAETRRIAAEKYEVEMGYGKCCLVNQTVLHRLGLNGFDLARSAHEDDMERFKREGLFAEDGDSNTAYMYIRYKVGPGASDDGAVVTAGKLYGLSAAVGCFLADAIDTLEKYVPTYGDQDSGISDYIEANCPDLGLNKEDSATLAYLCSIPNTMQGKLPDSSLRHMLQIDRKIDQCTIESHLAYVAGQPYSIMELDHGECTNKEFYDYIDQLLSKFEARH